MFECMKQLILILIFFVLTASSFAQAVGFDGELSIQSRHIWRGSKMGNAPAFEPSVTVSTGIFSLDFWAAVTPNNSYSEIDLIPAVQLGNITATLFDYYNPVPGEKNQFLNFREGQSRHSLEIAFDNYSSQQHLKWMAGTFLRGDKNPETGQSYYSTYVEFSYPIEFHKIEIEPVAGFTPFKGYYANHPAIILAGISFSRELRLSERWIVPIKAAISTNPHKANTYFTICSGIAFSAND